MKTIITYLCRIAFAVILCISLTSCPPEPTIDLQNDIIKTLMGYKWVNYDVSFGDAGNGHSWVDVDQSCLYFLSDSSGVCVIYHKSYDTDLEDSRDKSFVPFEYWLSSDHSIYIGFNGQSNEPSGFAPTMFIEGGNLVYESSSDIAYTKKELTSSDTELVKPFRPQKGKIGNVYYEYNTAAFILTIYGQGDIPNFTASNQPWRELYIRIIDIKPGITQIGDYAFYGFNSIQTFWDSSANYQSTIKRFGKRAFAYSSIPDITFDNSVEEIDDEAFAHCSKLKYIDWDSSAESKTKRIGYKAFYDTALEEIVRMPIKSVEEYGDYAFDSNEKYFEISKNCRKIGDCAFYTSKNSGAIWCYSSNPPQAGSSLTGNDSKKWSLYVPIGSKSKYQNTQPYSKFDIVESNTVTL